MAWHGTPPVVPRRPVVFAAAVVCAAAVLLTLVVTLPGNNIGPHVVGIRLIAAAALSPLLAGAVTSRWPVRP